jgi:hypothetical protein
MKSKLKHHSVPEMGLKPAALDHVEHINAFRDDESSSAPDNSEGVSSRDFFSAFRECARCFFSLTPEGTITYINPAIETLDGWNATCG